MAVTLLGVRFDAASSFAAGSAEAPSAIRQALRSPSSNTWSDGGHDLSAPSVLGDAGDIEPAPGPAGRDSIEAAVSDVLESQQRPMVLGGDHSITYPVVRALQRHHPNLAVLHLDAHADLYDEFDGDRYSHACPMARIMEEGAASRLVQIGVRTLNPAQRIQAQRFGVEIHEMRFWGGPAPIRFDRPVYITVDLDVLDPAFAPGVSHPEPGGLSVVDLLRQLRGVIGNVVGADLVEFNPRLDPSPRTGLVCAKILKTLVDLLQRPPQASGGGG